MKKFFLLMLCITSVLTANAQKSMVFNLGPKGAITESSDRQDTAKVFVYLPDAKLATGRAVVICPGGAYQFLAMDHEGRDWATFFNKQGIAAIVLKYRMPHGNRKVPVEDAEAAIRLTRSMADVWGVKRDQVGIMGSSAGGHLASVIATQSKGEAAPNFQILFYPVITMEPAFTHQESMNNLLGKDPHKKSIRQYSSDQQVTRLTPRAFIALSDDDTVVLPANGVNYYVECYRHDVPATLHVYPNGGHGWGYKDSFDHHIELLLDLKAWLNSF